MTWESEISVQTQTGTFLLRSDPTYTPNSTDNINFYDRQYLSPGAEYFATPIGIAGATCAVVLLGGSPGVGVHPNSFAIIATSLFVCAGNSVFAVTLPSLNLRWTIVADAAACFGVYPIETGLIVHGELEITRLSLDGTVVWKQSGSDIFTTEDGRDSFHIAGNRISVRSWDQRKYVFDLDGNILAEKPGDFA